MKITFALPSFPTRPWGGFKVIYEYANRLSAAGHQVSLVHPRRIEKAKSRSDRAKSYFWKSKLLLNHDLPIRWFGLRPEIEVRLARILDARAFPTADLAIATSWDTAPLVATLPEDRGRKLHFVQDVEFWEMGNQSLRADMKRSFRLDMPKVAVSPAAQAMLATVGVPTLATIPSGIDFDVFWTQIPIRERDRFRVGLPFRREPRKGTIDALRAMEILRSRFPNMIRPVIFGTDLPGSLPNWIEKWEAPSDPQLCQFYNSVSTFVLPSHHEAWGLPGLEAMACGAALVGADNAGVQGYAVNEESALLVPIANPEALAQAIERLLLDDRLRHRLAARGAEVAKRFDWSRAVDDLQEVLVLVSQAQLS